MSIMNLQTFENWGSYVQIMSHRYFSCWEVAAAEGHSPIVELMEAKANPSKAYLSKWLQQRNLQFTDDTLFGGVARAVGCSEGTGETSRHILGGGCKTGGCNSSGVGWISTAWSMLSMWTWCFGTAAVADLVSHHRPGILMQGRHHQSLLVDIIRGNCPHLMLRCRLERNHLLLKRIQGSVQSVPKGALGCWGGRSGFFQHWRNKRGTNWSAHGSDFYEGQGFPTPIQPLRPVEPLFQEWTLASQTYPDR